MKLLLDSHAFLWWCDGDERLSPAVRARIEGQGAETEVLISAASAWEIATKARIGKLPKAVEVARNLPAVARNQGFSMLAISFDHAHRAGSLAHEHRDPFDRMLAAQSMMEQIPIATDDDAIGALGAAVFW